MAKKIRRFVLTTFLVVVLFGFANPDVVLGQEGGDTELVLPFSAYSQQYTFNERLTSERLADHVDSGVYCWTILAGDWDDTNSQWGELVIKAEGGDYEVASGVEVGGACDTASRFCYAWSQLGVSCSWDKPGHVSVSGVPSQYLGSIWDSGGDKVDGDGHEIPLHRGNTAYFRNNTGVDKTLCWGFANEATIFLLDGVVDDITLSSFSLEKGEAVTKGQQGPQVQQASTSLTWPQVVWEWAKLGWRGVLLMVLITTVLSLWSENHQLKKALKNAGMEVRWVGPPRRYRGLYLLEIAMIAWLAHVSQQMWLWQFVRILSIIWVFSTIEIWWWRLRDANGWLPLLPDWLGTAARLLALSGLMCFLGGWISVDLRRVRSDFRVDVGGAWQVIASASLEEQGCDPALIYSIWKTETGVVNCQPYRDVGTTNPCLSYAGAQGPLQFMPGTWSIYADSTWDRWDLHDSTRAACRLVRAMGLQDVSGLHEFQMVFTASSGSKPCWNLGGPGGDYDGWEQAIEVYSVWRDR